MYPSPGNYLFKLSLDQPNTNYSLSLCPAQAREGNYSLAVYNPVPTAALAFNLTLHKIGRCLHNCSSHGRCAGVRDLMACSC